MAIVATPTVRVYDDNNNNDEDYYYYYYYDYYYYYYYCFTHTQLRFKPSCRQHAAPCYFCSSSRSP